jgi:hypothetical protein
MPIWFLCLTVFLNEFLWGNLLPPRSILKMGMIGFFAAFLPTHQTVWCHSQEECDLNTDHSENITSCVQMEIKPETWVV